jgi:hypothetical protein
MNGLAMTGCFSAGKPAGTQGALRVDVPDVFAERLPTLGIWLVHDEPHAVPENPGATRLSRFACSTPLG